jgi:hypothetical protein
MKASQFSDAQKAFILKQGNDGVPVAISRFLYRQSMPLVRIEPIEKRVQALKLWDPCPGPLPCA